jgi:tripartite-type tricarboxylate transporter receptor subunit TctC
MDKYKTSEDGRRLAKLVLASGEFGRPLVTPPGVPAERLKSLRDAFNKSVNDPALLAEAEKRRLEMDPATGEEIESLAREVMSSPPELVAKVQKLLGK